MGTRVTSLSLLNHHHSSIFSALAQRRLGVHSQQAEHQKIWLEETGGLKSFKA